MFITFGKVSRPVQFDISQKATAFYIDDDYQVDSAEEQEFKDLVRHSNIMQYFMEILSRSPKISRLTVEVEVLVEPAFSRLLPGNRGFPDEDSKKEEGARSSRYTNAAYRRATELFVDSGALEVLRELKNVKSFDLRFVKPEQKEDLLSKYLELAWDTNHAIEGN